MTKTKRGSPCRSGYPSAMSRRLGSIHDVAEELASGSAAIANLCVTGAGATSPEHTHANPYLWLHVLGAHREAGDGGERRIDGPAAMFFPAGSAHGMAVGGQGLASVIIEFDAGWLRRRLGGDADVGRPRLWSGPEAGRRASRLARLWLSGGEPAGERFAATDAFLDWALTLAPDLRPEPGWLKDLGELIDVEGATDGGGDLARALGVRRAWLGRAYRRWRGEGLPSALRRRRVAAAAALMEASDLPLAEVALAAGFCDQSHMNRGFQRVMGRTPAAVRAAKLGLVRARAA